MVKLLLDAGVNIDTMDTNEVRASFRGGGGLARISSHLGTCKHYMKCDVIPPPPPPPQAFLTVKFCPCLTSFLNEPLSYPEN